MSDIKSFFNEWCAKSRKEASYESRPTGNCDSVFLWKSFCAHFFFHNLGPKHRLRFLCEVRIPGLAYVGAGNSTTKKDAEKNAARDFVNFLVRTGQLNASDVPADALEGGGALPARISEVASAPVFQVSIFVLVILRHNL